jgi:propanol-preferring alcohol dehydrogenase
MTANNDLTIPKTQRAALSSSKEKGTVVEEIPVVQPEALEVGQALVKVLYSGVCHVSPPSTVLT